MRTVFYKTDRGDPSLLFEGIRQRTGRLVDCYSIDGTTHYVLVDKVPAKITLEYLDSLAKGCTTLFTVEHVSERVIKVSFGKSKTVPDSFAEAGYEKVEDLVCV